jgi:CRP/FNR family cyclic AMP-dependent transcriptional regulator
MGQDFRLSDVSILASLGEEELRQVAAAARSRAFERGEILFHEGDTAEALYILRSGIVKLTLIGMDGEESVLKVLGPGDTLGELSLLDGQPRSTTATALAPVEALVLHRREFLALLDRHRTVERAVLKQLATIVRGADARFVDVTSLDVGERLAKKLVELAERHGEVTAEGIRIPVPLTQYELASMLGLTRISIARHLARFRSEGILDTDRGGIVLYDLQALRRVGAVKPARP